MTTEIIALNQRPAGSADDDQLWLECYERWLEAVERRRGSARSREEYTKCVKLFFSFLGGVHPREVTGADCQRWASSMREAGLANSTIKARLAAVSSFYSFACAKFEAAPGRYLHNFNPASLVQRPHVNPYEHSQGLTVAQVRSLFKTFDQKSVAGSRDLALVAFYVYTGRRCIEVARLLWRDLRRSADSNSAEGEEAEEWEYHYAGKGNKISWREVPAPVLKYLKQYLKLAGRWDSMLPDSPLFVSFSSNNREPDKRLSNQYIRRILQKAADRAGLGHVKVHGLRHTAAKLRRTSGASLEEVSKFLDHSSLAVTQVYLGAIEAKKDDGWKKVQDLLEDI